MLGSQLFNVQARYNGRDFGLPAVNSFGEMAFREAVVTGDSWELHRGLEIVFMLDGEACWELPGQHPVRVSGGQAITFPAGTQHRIVNGVYPPSRAFWIVLASRESNASTGLLSRDELVLITRAVSIAERSINCSDEIARHVRELGKLLRDKRLLIGDRRRIADIRARLYSVVVDFWSLCEAGASTAPKSRPVHRSEDLIRSTLEKRLSIGNLASLVGYSRSRLHFLFRHELGITPTDYRQRLRIKQCCERLTESDEPITSISGEAGFSSTQYFARVFRRYLGVTPTAYRQLTRR